MHLFDAGEVPCHFSARNGYAARILPFHRDEARGLSSDVDPLGS
jgi:hypothetical protein